MTGAVALLAVGLALAVLAVIELPVGGRPLGLARLQRWPRIAAGAVGALCVVSAAILLLSDDGRLPAGPVTEPIVDELGPGQTREEVRVFIDGRDVGVLKIDERAPKARLLVTVARAGTYPYRTTLVKERRGKAPLRISRTSRILIDGKGYLEVSTSVEGAHLQPPR